MNDLPTQFELTGLEVLDAGADSAFAAHPVHSRGVAEQMEAMQRLVRALVESPDTILQELVNAAVELCGADSAGISMEKPGGSESDFYHWIATAGVYSDFCDAAAQSQRLRDMSGAWWSTALSGGSGIFQYS